MNSRWSRGAKRSLVLGGMLGAVGLLPLVGQAQPPANVIFLLDNSESMQDFPIYLPEDFTPGYSPTTGTTAGYPGYNDPAYGHFINTGCSDPALVYAMQWFDKGSPDPAKNGSLPYDGEVNPIHPTFHPSRFYQSRGRRIAWQAKELPYSLSKEFNLTGTANAEDACLQVSNYDIKYYRSPIYNECLSCLAAKGWWRGPLVPATSNASGGMLGPSQASGEPPLPREARRKWILSGRVLNVHPPLFAIVRKVFKDVINQHVSNVRVGVATFGGERGWYDPPTLLAQMRPGCSASFPIDEAQLDRPSLVSAVYGVKFTNNERSTGEALFGLGGYFSSQAVDGQWSSWFAQPVGTSTWGWPGLPSGGTYDNPYTGQSGADYAMAADEWLKQPYTDPTTGVVLPGQPWEQGGDHRSICSADQVNAVIVLTSGSPQQDNSVPITKMMELLIAQGAQHPDGTLLTFDPVVSEHTFHPGGVNYCDQFERYPGMKWTKSDCDYTDYNWPHGLALGNKNFMDDVAFFLSHADLRGDLPGTQRVRTFVINYGWAPPMLHSIALAGQGSFFQAYNPTLLRDALLRALQDIRAATP
jgi:hypothetical protein